MASTSRQPPAPGEQQRVHQDDHQRNLPMPPTTGHERYDGVLVETHNGNNDGNGVKVTDRAGAASTLFLNDSDGCHADSTSAADDTTTAAPGARGKRGKAAALVAPEPEPRRTHSGQKTVREMPRYTEPPLPLPEELSPRTARAEISKLSRYLAETRAVAGEATESRRRAEERVAELEEVIAESARQHELFRERGEARLEMLKRAFVQEQEEGGAHVRRPPTGRLLLGRRPLLLGRRPQPNLFLRARFLFLCILVKREFEERTRSNDGIKVVSRQHEPFAGEEG